MGSGCVSLTPSDESRKRTAERKVFSDEGNSLVELLSKGTTHLSNVLDASKSNRKGDSSGHSSSRSLVKSLQGMGPPLPSFRSIRKIVPSEVKNRSGLAADGQTSPDVLHSREQLSDRLALIQSPVWEDSLHVDSLATTGAEYAVEPKFNGADLTVSVPVRPCSSHQVGTFLGNSELPKFRRESEEPILQTRHNIRTMMHTNQDLHTNPYSKQYNSYSMPQQPITSDAYCRPRSRAIAIKRTRRCAEELAASQTEESNERMYDWATWRMYNRIVDHRRNQNYGVPGPLPVSTEDVKRKQTGGISGDESILSNQLSDLTYDGEVFELEI